MCDLEILNRLGQPSQKLRKCGYPAGPGYFWSRNYPSPGLADKRFNPFPMFNKMVGCVAIDDIDRWRALTVTRLLRQVIPIALAQVSVGQRLQELEQLSVGRSKLSQSLAEGYIFCLLINNRIDLIVGAFQIQRFFYTEALMARQTLKEERDRTLPARHMNHVVFDRPALSIVNGRQL